MQRKPRVSEVIVEIPEDNLYQRPNSPFWQGRIRINNKEYRKSLRTADVTKARSEFDAWKRHLEAVLSGEVSEESDEPTWEEAVVAWADHLQRQTSGKPRPAVKRRYLCSVRQMGPTFEGMKLAAITPKTIAKYVNSRIGVVNNATIRRDLSALSHLFRVCRGKGMVENNPVLAYDRSIIEESRVPEPYPDPRDVETVIAAAPPGMAKVLRVLDGSGMRMQEAVTLEDFQIDFKREQVILTKTKTNRPRTLAFKSPAGDLGPALAAGERQGFLFLSEQGHEYKNFSANFRRIALEVAAREQAAGRPFRRFKLHHLRHGFAVRWLKSGGSIYKLSKYLGHANVRTTEDHYLGFLTAEEQEACRAEAA